MTRLCNFVFLKHNQICIFLAREQLRNIWAISNKIELFKALGVQKVHLTCIRSLGAYFDLQVDLFRLLVVEPLPLNTFVVQSISN